MRYVLLLSIGIVTLASSFRVPLHFRMVQKRPSLTTTRLCYVRDGERGDEVLCDFLDIFYRMIREEVFVSLSFTNKKEYLSKISLPASWNTKKVSVEKRAEEEHVADRSCVTEEDGDICASVESSFPRPAASVDLGNGLINIQGRLVLIKGAKCLQLHAKYKRCDQVKNFAIDSSTQYGNQINTKGGSGKRLRKSRAKVLPSSREELVAILSMGGFRKVDMVTVDTKYTLRLKCSYIEGAKGDSERADPRCECICTSMEVKELKKRVEVPSLLHDNSKPTAVEQLLLAQNVVVVDDDGGGGTDGYKKKEVGRYLQFLGVTNSRGMPVKGKGDKLKQIRKFSEIVDNLVDKACLITPSAKDANSALTNQEHTHSDDKNAVQKELLVLDAGCGKGYLTFCTHELLFHKWQTIHGGPTHTTTPTVRTLGVENRRGLVAQTNSIAREMGVEFDGLAFACADIDQLIGSSTTSIFGDDDVVPIAIRDDNEGGDSDGNYRKEKKKQEEEEEGQRLLELYRRRVDVVIALHACDTATDDALYYAVRNSARVVMVAPCCQKELRGQINEVAIRCGSGDDEGARALRG